MPALLPGMLRLRERSSRWRVSPQGSARLQGPGTDRRHFEDRRGLSSVARFPGGRGAPREAQGADGSAPSARSPKHTHPGRHQCRPSNTRRVARAPEPERRGFDRRPAARARRPAQAGDLHAYFETHRRSPDHGSLHDHPPDDGTAGVPPGVSRFLEPAPGSPQDLVQSLHATKR